MPDKIVKYTSRTHNDIRADLLAAIPSLAPALTSHGEDEPFIALVDMLAGVGDSLHYYFDKQALETFLPTVKLRKNAMRLAHLVGYRPARAIASEGFVTFTALQVLPHEIYVPELTKLVSPTGTGVVTTEDLYFPKGFTGTQTVRVVQGELVRERTVVSGTDPTTINLGTRNPSEQLMRVTSYDKEWIEFRDSAPQDTINRWYHYGEDTDGNVYVRFVTELGTVPMPGTPVIVQYLLSENVSIAPNTALNPLTLPPPDGPPDIVAAHQLALSMLSLKTSEIGGYKPRETVNQIRYRAPRSLHTRFRAVEEDDYEFLAKNVPGIKKVKAVASDFYAREVKVYALGLHNDPVSSDTLDILAAYLKARSELTLNVVAFQAPMEPYYLTVEVSPKSGYTEAAAVYAVKSALFQYLSETATDFGRTLRVGEIYAVANRIEEVSYVNVTKLYLDDGSPAEVDDITPSTATSVLHISNNLSVTPIITP